MDGIYGPGLAPAGEIGRSFAEPLILLLRAVHQAPRQGGGPLLFVHIVWALCGLNAEAESVQTQARGARHPRDCRVPLSFQFSLRPTENAAAAVVDSLDRRSMFGYDTVGRRVYTQDAEGYLATISIKGYGQLY